MANRVVVQADVDNSIYSNWIDTNIIPMHGVSAAMQVGDRIIDDETDNYLPPSSRSSNEWWHNYTGAASGNNSGNTDYVITTAIDTDLPSDGVFVVDNAAATPEGIDYYHYSSYTGSTFTLDVTDHPTGLDRTYLGSETAWGWRTRIGATWWWDGVAMGMDITDPSTFAWFNIPGFSVKYASTNEKPITHRPIRGLVGFDMNASNKVIFVNSCFDHVIIDGESIAYPGFRNITSQFIHGTFGFVAWDHSGGSKTGNCFVLDYGTNAVGKPSYALRGLEAIQGFAGFRIARGGTGKNILIKSVHIQRCYRHDAFTGEGNYFGNNSGDTLVRPLFEKVFIEDNVFVRCAAETIQIQDMVDNTIVSRIRNNTSLGGATDVLTPFQLSQGNCYQLNQGDGNVFVNKNIASGSYDSGLIQFGSPSGGGVGRIKYFDNLFLDHRRWMYIHSTTALPNIVFEWQRMHVGRMSNRYKRGLIQTAPSASISVNNGTANFKFKQVTKDSTPPALLYNTITDFEVAGGGDDNTFSEPQFVNAGLYYGEYAGEKYDYFGNFSFTRYNGDYNGRKISSILNNGSGIIRVKLQNAHSLSGGETVFLHGTANYDGSYVGAAVVITSDTIDVTGVSYIADEGIVDWAYDTPPTFHNGEIVTISNIIYGTKFMQCLTDNFEIPTWDYDTETDPTNFEPIFWDANGVRSDEAGYTGTPDPATGGIFPPDDVRLVPGSYWGNRGYGVRWQEHSTDYEKYRWYIADDAIGTNKLIIPEAKEKAFDINELTYEWVAIQTGKYVVGSITPVDANGLTGTEVFATGIII